MSKFVIRGGRRLLGRVNVSGSKNAALPIIFATVIAEGVSHIYGVPDISDVNIALQIIEELGAVVTREGDTLHIDTANLTYRAVSCALTEKIRASSYLLGCEGARFLRTELTCFGGCNFDSRPVDMHVAALRAVGFSPYGREFFASSLTGADINFDKISVGATVNALLLTARAKGTSRIRGFAREPHVYALIDFINSAGGCVSVHGDVLVVEGRHLHGGSIRIPADMIEAGSYIIAALATSSTIDVCGFCHDELSVPLSLLASAGAGFRIWDGGVSPFLPPCEPFSVYTAPYPAFPTDLQPQTAPLLALCRGGSITEGVWRGRFGYLNELAAFGVKYRLFDGGAEIYPSELRPACVSAPDLRGGVALLIAALAADGESVIDEAQIICRGYENVIKKLRAVGAEIYET